MLGLAGLIAPIVTPLTDDGDSISEVRLARLIRHLLAQGVAGFACCTETGEFTTISASERKQVLEIVMREAHGAPVLAHCTRLGTSQALDLCQHAGRHGAKAAIVMPPYFGKLSDDEIEHHLRSIAQHAGLPVIIVDPNHLVRSNMRANLANLPELFFAASPESALRTRYAVDPIGAGSDEFVLEGGIVSPLVQIDPEAATDSHERLHEIGKMVALYGRARVAKAALNLRDVEVGPPRSPILSLGDEARIQLAGLVQTG